jgi:hypothetical protein
MDALIDVARWILETPLVLWPLLASVALPAIAEWRAHLRWEQGCRWSR